MTDQRHDEMPLRIFMGRKIKVCKLSSNETTSEGSYYVKVDGDNIGTDGRAFWNTEAEAEACGRRFIMALANLSPVMTDEDVQALADLGIIEVPQYAKMSRKELIAACHAHDAHHAEHHAREAATLTPEQVDTVRNNLEHIETWFAVGQKDGAGLSAKQCETLSKWVSSALAILPHGEKK